MKPLFVLITTFIVALSIIKMTSGKLDYRLAGRISMAIMLIFTAIGHFVYGKGMAMMVPEFIPNKLGLVYLTGIMEIMFAFGLFMPSTFKMTGIALIFSFLMILPANVYASINHVDFQNANFEGPGTQYLWFRVPLQILFIFWVYFSAISTLLPR